MEQETQATENGANETKTMTFNELLESNKEYQSEFDKRVAKSIDTAVKNALAKKQEELELEKSEAERLAKLSEEEKTQEKIKGLEARALESENKLKAYELKNATIDIANEKGIDISLLNLIDFSKENAESINAKLETIEQTYKKAVENGVNAQLREKTPIQKENVGDEGGNSTGNTVKLNPIFR